MVAAVFCPCHHLKIRKPVVQFVSVSVMYYFIPFQLPSQLPFHFVPMFLDKHPPDIDSPVPIGRDVPTPIVVRFFANIQATLGRTETAGSNAVPPQDV